MRNTIVNTCLLPPQSEREDGFTLIEILVVIIIIGILAAVAIPIFLNQQAAARDSATTQDARNLASNLYTLASTDPDIKQATLSGGHDDPDDTKYTITSDGGSTLEVTKTEGTVFSSGGSNDAVITYTPAAAEFTFEAWNENGREYLLESPLVWANGALEGVEEEETNAGEELVEIDRGNANPLIAAALKAQHDSQMYGMSPEAKRYTRMMGLGVDLNEEDRAAYTAIDTEAMRLSNFATAAAERAMDDPDAYGEMVELSDKAASDPTVQELYTELGEANRAYSAELTKLTDDYQFENPGKVQELYIAFQNANLKLINAQLALL